MIAEYLLVSVLLSAVYCIDSNILLDRNIDGDSRESFPGHVALRPDYTFWNMAKMLRKFFDSNAEQQIPVEPTSIRRAYPTIQTAPFLLRDLRSRRMLLNSHLF
ncbi:hypothetical protein RB195_020170 [Necator americanus]